jgi:hypothetical protein
MSEAVASIARVLIATLQGVGVIYVALVAWISSSWMTDDSWAARATDGDWWLLAGKRSLIGLAMALTVGVVLLVINRALMYWKLESASARPLRTALIGALVVAAASAAGAIQFAIQRPWF